MQTQIAYCFSGIKHAIRQYSDRVHNGSCHQHETCHIGTHTTRSLTGAPDNVCHQYKSGIISASALLSLDYNY